MSEPRRFTWEQANALVPRLTEIFGVIAQLRTQLRQIHGRLGALGIDPTAGEPQEVTPEGARLHALFGGLYETLTEQVGEVETMGGLIKDLEVGLVDFLWEKGGRDVLLCWRYGETELGFWHGMDDGFRGRQPVDDADRARGRTLH
jgi:hypothetical protein